MRRLTFMMLFIVVSLGAAACSGDDEGSSTTLVPEDPEPLSAEVEEEAEGSSVGDVAVDPEGTVASTIAPATEVIVGLPTYEVVGETGDEGNETMVVVVAEGDYSNVELENLVFDIVDRFSPERLLVVDSSEAAALFLSDQITDQQNMFIAQHSILRVDAGVEVTFLGPYGDIPALTVGS